MLERVDRDELKKLTFAIVEARKSRTGKGDRESILAYNDALHVLRIYSKRQEFGR